MPLDAHHGNHTDISDVRFAVISNGVLDSVAATDEQVLLHQMVTLEAEVLKEITAPTAPGHPSTARLRASALRCLTVAWPVVMA